MCKNDGRLCSSVVLYSVLSPQSSVLVTSLICRLRRIGGKERLELLGADRAEEDWALPLVHAEIPKPFRLLQRLDADAADAHALRPRALDQAAHQRSPL